MPRVYRHVFTIRFIARQFVHPSREPAKGAIVGDRCAVRAGACDSLVHASVHASAISSSVGPLLPPASRLVCPFSKADPTARAVASPSHKYRMCASLLIAPLFQLSFESSSLAAISTANRESRDSSRSSRSVSTRPSGPVVHPSRHPDFDPESDRTRCSLESVETHPYAAGDARSRAGRARRISVLSLKALGVHPDLAGPVQLVRMHIA